MAPFEYALALMSILMGLAVGDVVLSLNRLVRNARLVAWDPRPLMAAALVLVELVRIWFAQWALRDFGLALGFPLFLMSFVHVLLLVFLAAAVLPDDCNERVDLGQYYERNRRYFWSLFASAQAVYFLLWLGPFRGGQGDVSA
jgi:hypothetical protein